MLIMLQITWILLLLLLLLLSPSSPSSSFITYLIIAYYCSIFQRKGFLNFFKLVIRDHMSLYVKNKLNSW